MGRTKARNPEDLPTISFPLSPENCVQSMWKEMIGSMAPSENLFKPKPESMAMIIYTSGSTGKPEDVMIDFKQ